MSHDESEPRIIADIEMLHADDGGRVHAIAIDAESRYMPHLVIDDRKNRIAQHGINGVSENYMGVWFLPALSITDSKTGSGRYPLRLMYHPRVDYTTLNPGATFTVREGGKIVGHGVVVDCDSTSGPRSQGGRALWVSLAVWAELLARETSALLVGLTHYPPFTGGLTDARSHRNGSRIHS